MATGVGLRSAAVGGQWGRATAVLFTDIARSTELMFALGAERNEGVRRRHMAHLREALQEHGGREVKNLGDGIMAVVPSAAGAVAAAVAMQQRTAAQAAAAGLELELTIGVSIGDAFEEHEDWFGPPVVEAARLCQLAAAGEVLIPRVLRDLAGDRPGVVYEAVGPRALKGIPEPVEVFRVCWSPAPGSAFRLPAMLSGHGRYEMVGRDAERAQVLATWDVAARGERRVVLIGGEPGVGKSRLAANVAGNVHAFGGRVLLGRCDREGGGPFQPFVIALRQHLAEVAASGAPVRLGPHAGVLVRVLPELVELGPSLQAPASGDDAAADRLALFDAIADAFHRIAADAPVLLVVEDLHWAAPETIQLFRHLIGWSQDGPLLVLSTFRNTDADLQSELGALVAESSRLQRCQHIPLHRLDEPSVLRLLSAAAGEDLSGNAEAAEVAATLYEQSGGNPLYATQLLAHLVEAGILQRSDGRWTATAPADRLTLPESLREVVLGRVTASAAPVQRLLELAAVAGERFDPVLLLQIDDTDGQLLDALDQAVAARLVEQVGSTAEYRFIHALVRAVVLDRLSTVRRAGVHDKLAERLEELGVAEPAYLAHHSAESALLGPPQAARAVRSARRAGDEAMAAFEFLAASRWYEVALSNLARARLDQPRERAEALLALGVAQRNGGIQGFRETLLEATRVARAAGLTTLQIQATLANTRGTFANARALDEDRIELLRAALAAIPEPDDVDRAQLMCQLAMELCIGPGFEERRALSAEAVRLARETGDAKTVAWVLARREPAVVHIVTIGERAAEVEELARLAEGSDDDQLRFWAMHHSVKIGLELGDRERIENNLARLESLVVAMRQPEPRVLITRDRGTYASVRGRLDEAERATFESLELGEQIGAPDARYIFASQLYSIRFVQGRLGELREAMARSKGPRWIPAVWAGWSLLHAEIGERAEALDSLQAQHDVDFWNYPNGHVATSGIAAAALAAARVGDDTLAVRLLDVLDAADGFCIADVCYWYGPVAHHQGILRSLLGEVDRAVEHFAAAIALERRLEATPWLARSLAELARALGRRHAAGDQSAADEAAAEARSIASSLGLAAIRPLLDEPLPGEVASL